MKKTSKHSGLFITLEGTDGVGKSTHARLLAKWFHKAGRRTILTREPGGSPLSEKVRNLLLHTPIKIDNLTELFLYEAARIEHVRNVIEPALKRGRVVICDRFIDATIAYQGFGRGLPNSMIHLLNKIAMGRCVPDLTLLLDYPPKQALKKARKKSKRLSGDRLEREGVSFQERVRKGYLSQAKKFPKRIRFIPVQETVEETQALIRKFVSQKVSR